MHASNMNFKLRHHTSIHSLNQTKTVIEPDDGQILNHLLSRSSNIRFLFIFVSVFSLLFPMVYQIQFIAVVLEYFMPPCIRNSPVGRIQKAKIIYTTSGISVNGRFVFKAFYSIITTHYVDHLLQRWGSI